MAVPSVYQLPLPFDAKTCRICNRTQPLEAFSPTRRTRDGRRHMCTECYHQRNGYMASQGTLITVVCTVCGKSLVRNFYNVRQRWKGKCASCAAKESWRVEDAYERRVKPLLAAKSTPEFIQAQRERSREQVLRQGGIPNRKLLTSERVRGAANWNWKGGRSAHKRPVADAIYVAWRTAVFQRDNYTCQECDQRGVQLNAHHIESWRDHVDLRYDIANGLTLCGPCHREWHRTHPM